MWRMWLAMISFCGKLKVGKTLFVLEKAYHKTLKQPRAPTTTKDGGELTSAPVGFCWAAVDPQGVEV